MRSDSRHQRDMTSLRPSAAGATGCLWCHLRALKQPPETPIWKLEAAIYYEPCGGGRRYSGQRADILGPGHRQRGWAPQMLRDAVRKTAQEHELTDALATFSHECIITATQHLEGNFKYFNKLSGETFDDLAISAA
jgi:hypothetical protein